MVRFEIATGNDEHIVKLSLKESNGGIDLLATDGNRMCYIVGITKDGKLIRYAGITVDGFDLDQNKYIIMEDE